MLRSIQVITSAGLLAALTLAAHGAQARRDAEGTPAAGSGSIRYAPPQRGTVTRGSTPATARATPSGSIHYPQPRPTTPAPTIARPNTGSGSIHYSRPGTVTTPRSQVAVGSSGNVYTVTPRGDRPGTTYRPAPTITPGRPLDYRPGGGSSTWHRPPVRPGYRPPIAEPIRGFDRSHWQTVLRPWSVAPIGGGYGALAGQYRPYDYRHYVYRPDGGRIGYYPPPAWGMVYPSLPSGAIVFTFGRSRYYAWGGVYYMPWESGYRVVRPPIGAVVSYLPPDYSYMDVGETRYFCSSNVYYTYVPPEAADPAAGWADAQGDEAAQGYYAVVDPPIGAQVNELPPGAETETEDGRTYYRVDHAWYMPIYQEGNLQYMRVPRPE